MVKWRGPALFSCHGEDALFIRLTMKHTVCLLVLLAITLGQECDINDDACRSAVKFSEKAKVCSAYILK